MGAAHSVACWEPPQPSPSEEVRVHSLDSSKHRGHSSKHSRRPSGMGETQSAACWDPSRHQPSPEAKGVPWDSSKNRVQAVTGISYGAAGHVPRGATGRVVDIRKGSKIGGPVILVNWEAFPQLDTVSVRLEQFAFIREEEPGPYIVTSGAAVTATPALSSDILGTVEEGTCIDVLEVMHCKEDKRWRGRTAKPVDGWLSLLACEDGHRWALQAKLACGPPKVAPANAELEELVPQLLVPLGTAEDQLTANFGGNMTHPAASREGAVPPHGYPDGQALASAAKQHMQVPATVQGRVAMTNLPGQASFEPAPAPASGVRCRTSSFHGAGMLPGAVPMSTRPSVMGSSFTGTSHTGIPVIDTQGHGPSPAEVPSGLRFGSSGHAPPLSDRGLRPQDKLGKIIPPVPEGPLLSPGVVEKPPDQYALGALPTGPEIHRGLLGQPTGGHVVH